MCPNALNFQTGLECAIDRRLVVCWNFTVRMENKWKENILQSATFWIIPAGWAMIHSAPFIPDFTSHKLGFFGLKKSERGLRYSPHSYPLSRCHSQLELPVLQLGHDPLHACPVVFNLTLSLRPRWRYPGLQTKHGYVLWWASIWSNGLCVQAKICSLMSNLSE